MLESVVSFLRRIEAALGTPSLGAALPLLHRGLGIDEFGELMFGMPNLEFPALSHALPNGECFSGPEKLLGAEPQRGLRLFANTSPPEKQRHERGRTSMTAEWITTNIPHRRVVSRDRSLDDPQVYLSLRTA